FFKEDGHIAALLNNDSDFFLKDENKDQLVSKVQDRKILGELYKNNPTLLLYWPSCLSKNPEKGNVNQLDPACRQPYELKPTGCVAQVAREMIIQANRLFEGSKKLSVPGKSTWEMVLSDVKNYPTEVILEASNAN
ncbi:hypothetical protein, partial [Criblamydia sequanensis]|uniref:hypothetical protein n=1 Tax=Candidatus Criblamydia sequanensis TaxID=340071 RepID=UPI0005961998